MMIAWGKIFKVSHKIKPNLQRNVLGFLAHKHLRYLNIMID